MKGIAGTGMERFADCPTCGQEKGAKCVRVQGPCRGTVNAANQHSRRCALAVEAGWQAAKTAAPAGRRFNDEFDYPASAEEEAWASQFTCPHCGPASCRMVTSKKTCLRCESKQCPKGRRCAGQSLRRG